MYTGEPGYFVNQAAIDRAASMNEQATEIGRDTPKGRQLLLQASELLWEGHGITPYIPPKDSIEHV